MHCVINHSRIPLPKPNTFAGLMEMYENNYIKLRKLCGDIKKLPAYSRSRIDDSLEVHIQVIERTKYTITLNLTYTFSHSTKHSNNALPDLYIKVYFDAMQAEVIHRKEKCHSVQREHKKLGNKWRDNRFLYKWLTYCLALGHSFT